MTFRYGCTTLDIVNVRVIEVPYNLGQERVGVANGPPRLQQCGLQAALQADGFDVEWSTIKRQAPFAGALQSTTDLNTQVRHGVEAAVGDGRFPILVSGNCNASLGAISALGVEDTGVIWFDAHGDFNTPETSSSGFLDGMALAIATGRCYPEEWQRMGNEQNVPDRNIMLAAIRELDNDEAALIHESDCVLSLAADLRPASFDDYFVARLRQLRTHATRAFVHLDVDALDPEEAPGVEYKSPDGVSAGQMQRAIDAIGERFQIAGVTLADFNPEFDKEEKTASLCVELIARMARNACHTQD